MGYPIDEYDDGDPCTFCWGEGKAFGDVLTPEKLYFTIAGFVGAQAECNGEWIAYQDVDKPCWFWFQEGNVFGSLEFQIANTQFQIRWMGGIVFIKAEGLCATHSEILPKTFDVS